MHFSSLMQLPMILTSFQCCWGWFSAHIKHLGWGQWPVQFKSWQSCLALHWCELLGHVVEEKDTCQFDGRDSQSTPQTHPHCVPVIRTWQMLDRIQSRLMPSCYGGRNVVSRMFNHRDYTHYFPPSTLAYQRLPHFPWALCILSESASFPMASL